MGGVARAVGNRYDLNGNRIRVIHPDTSFFTYELDGLDRPLRIHENGGDPIAAFTYDSAGRRASSGWTATTSYGYDPVGRLQTQSHDLAGSSRDHVLGFTFDTAPTAGRLTGEVFRSGAGDVRPRAVPPIAHRLSRTATTRLPTPPPR